MLVPLVPHDMKCEWCLKRTLSFIMSIFSTDMLCPACKESEKLVPGFEEAREAELAACRKGNYNFPGVGIPGGAKR